MNKLQEIQPIDNYYLHRLKLRLENLKSMRALSGLMGAGPWLNILNSGESGIMALILTDLDDRIDLISRAIKRERGEIGEELFDKTRKPIILPSDELRRVPFLSSNPFR